MIIEQFSELTKIEEVGGLTTFELDDVHGSHSETSTVDETSDITIHADVVEAKLLSFNFTGISFGIIAHGKDILLAVCSVVVEVDLGIEADNLTLWSFTKGVDFDLEDYYDHLRRLFT